MKLQELTSLGFSTVDIPRFDKMDLGVVRLAWEMWSRLGVRPQITSSYRTPVQNAQAQGVQNSQHIQGKALDLVFPGVDPVKVIGVAESLGAKGLALQWPTGSVHIDTRDGDKARWGERVDSVGGVTTKSHDHPLAEIVALFTGGVSAGPLKLGPVPIPQTTAGRVGAGVIIAGAVVFLIYLLSR